MVVKLIINNSYYEKKMIELIYSSLLPLISQQIDTNDKTNFIGKKKPNIHLRRYIQRIIEYGNASEFAYILAIYYVYKLNERVSNDFINEWSIHRIFLASLLIAIKYTDDIYYTNGYYAKVGGIKTIELNQLEIEFLARLNFDLYYEESNLLNFQKDIFKPFMKNGELLLS